MRLNQLGHIARSHWLKLPQHHSHLQLDAFVMMPNHIHGILVLNNILVGAGLADHLTVELMTLTPKPALTDVPVHTNYRGISEIIRGFKTFSARRINQIRKVKNVAVWQRNYYEHIIRNEASLQQIRQYIQNNPLSWHQDQLHPEHLLISETQS